VADELGFALVTGRAPKARADTDFCAFHLAKIDQRQVTKNPLGEIVGNGCGRLAVDPGHAELHGEGLDGSGDEGLQRYTVPKRDADQLAVTGRLSYPPGNVRQTRADAEHDLRGLAAIVKVDRQNAAMVASEADMEGVTRASMRLHSRKHVSTVHFHSIPGVLLP